jgi:transcriptional regulatory protein LevR
MDYLLRRTEYRRLVDEVALAGEEHLKVILQDSSNYLEKAYECRNKISSDSSLSIGHKEELLREVNGYIERVEERLKEKPEQTNVLSILTHVAAFGIGYFIGYNKKSGEILERQEFMSEVLVALKEELKKYL